MQRLSLFLILHFCLLFPLCSQHSVKADIGLGRVIKHKEGLLFNIPKSSLHVSLYHQIESNGSQAWHRFWRYPRVTHNLAYIDFGDELVLGKAVALMRGLDFDLWSTGKLSLRGNFLTGIGYLNQTFSRVDNPTNNAIGSHINNATRMGISLTYPVTSRWRMSWDSFLQHFSNGRFATPNSGINTWSSGISIAYLMIPEDRATISKVNEAQIDTAFSQHWLLDMQVQLSRSEQIVPGGPKYGNVAISFGMGRRYHPLLTGIIGLDYEYRSGQYEFYIRDFYPQEEARDLATRTALFLANDFHFNRIIFRPQLGIYLPYPQRAGDIIYFKLGALYKLPEVSGMHYTMGVTLKSHFAVAEYVALTIGLQI